MAARFGQHFGETAIAASRRLAPHAAARAARRHRQQQIAHPPARQAPPVQQHRARAQADPVTRQPDHAPHAAGPVAVADHHHVAARRHRRRQPPGEQRRPAHQPVPGPAIGPFRHQQHIARAQLRLHRAVVHRHRTERQAAHQPDRDEQQRRPAQQPDQIGTGGQGDHPARWMPGRSPRRQPARRPARQPARRRRPPRAAPGRPGPRCEGA